MSPKPSVNPTTENFMRNVPIYCVTTGNDLSSANFHDVNFGGRASENAVEADSMIGLMRNL